MYAIRSYYETETPIEPVAKFCQIARKMPIAHCVVGATESILDIAQDDIEPFEHIAMRPQRDGPLPDPLRRAGQLGGDARPAPLRRRPVGLLPLGLV